MFDKYLACQKKTFPVEKVKANYNFSGFASVLINVPICLQNLSQKSDLLAKLFGWVLGDC